ncbi:hypothetical protein Mapa_016965 [Marchantia paleacea]|nr:hypothetical protein Mapa_016965 [Marchantia paleacea]
MVRVVDEDTIVGSTINNLPTTTCDCILVSQNDSEEVVRGHIFSCIILVTKRIHAIHYANLLTLRY